MALLWVDDREDFEVEVAQFRTSNVLTLQLMTGRDQYYIVGCYIAPTDTETVNHVRAAWDACPEGCIPLLLGDLNASLRDPVSPRDDAIADMTDEADIVDLSRHFRQRRCRRQGGGGVTGSDGRGDNAASGGGLAPSQIISWLGRGTSGILHGWDFEAHDTTHRTIERSWHRCDEGNRRRCVHTARADAGAPSRYHRRPSTNQKWPSRR